MWNLIKSWIKLIDLGFSAGKPYPIRLKSCQICHGLVTNTLQIPSSTGLWVCYDCFSYWIEGYPPEELIFKIIRHWRNKVY